jgi:hypothetical protein
MIPLPDASVTSQLRLSFAKNESIIPNTTGTSYRPNDEPCLIVIFANDSNESATFKQESQAKNLVFSIRNNYVS